MILLLLPLLNLCVHASSLNQMNEAQKQALILELTGQPSKIKTDLDYYSEIATAYQSNNLAEFKIKAQKFLEKYPHSTIADNTLFLMGRSALDSADYNQALKHFSSVLHTYPKGHKVVSARFYTGVVYKKMNLSHQARNVFLDVIKKYQGSPESYQASTELRLLR